MEDKGGCAVTMCMCVSLCVCVCVCVCECEMGKEVRMDEQTA